MSAKSQPTAIERPTNPAGKPVRPAFEPTFESARLAESLRGFPDWEICKRGRGLRRRYELVDRRGAEAFAASASSLLADLDAFSRVETLGTVAVPAVAGENLGKVTTVDFERGEMLGGWARKRR